MHFSLISGTLANAVVYGNFSWQRSCKFSDGESRIDLTWAFKSPSLCTILAKLYGFEFLVARTIILQLINF